MSWGKAGNQPLLSAARQMPRGAYGIKTLQFALPRICAAEQIDLYSLLLSKTAPPNLMLRLILYQIFFAQRLTTFI